MASEFETLSAIEKSGNLNPYQATQLANLKASGAGGTGGSSPRLDFTKELTNKMMTADATEKVKVDAARSSLIDYYKGLEDPTARYTRLSQSTGLNDQQKLVEGLTKDVMTQQDAVEAIPASVLARSGNFLINDADKTAITNRESKPVIDNLNKLLRNKQYEEVGLAGKQQLVATLLDLSFKGDEMGAKPLQLGVDYTTEDRQIARDLFTTVLSAQSSAFNGDQDSRDAEARAASDRAFQESMQSNTFQQQDKTNATDFAQQLALKSAAAATASSNKATTAAKKEAEQKTTDAWNKIVAGSKTEYDVWKKINTNQKTLSSQGVDVSKLWSQHAALAAKTGTGGAIRKTAEDDL